MTFDRLYQQTKAYNEIKVFVAHKTDLCSIGARVIRIY